MSQNSAKTVVCSRLYIEKADKISRLLEGPHGLVTG